MTSNFKSIISSTPFRLVVLLLWIVLIFWLSLDPAPPVPEPRIIGWDKFLHVIAYGCLTFFAGWAINGIAPLNKSYWFLIAFASIILGGSMEFLQMAFTNNRTAEFTDFLADVFGVGIVLVIIFSTRRYQNILTVNEKGTEKTTKII